MSRMTNQAKIADGTSRIGGWTRQTACLTAVLLLSVSLGSCRRSGLARAAAEEGARRDRQKLFHWLENEPARVTPPVSGSVYTGSRPACARRFRSLLPLAAILRHCSAGERPIVFQGPNWCRYRFEQGNFLLFESPSFAHLRQALVEGVTIRTPTGWGFSWTNARGVSSVVLRKPDGSALTIQAPRSLCSTEALRRLAHQAASGLAGETTEQASR